MNGVGKELAFADTLPESERKTLINRCAEKAYAKGVILFHAEDQADYVWVLKQGRVHLTKYTSQGRILTNCVMIPGDVFCCLSSLDGKAYPAEAVAALPSVVLKIPIGIFQGWMQKYPAFAQKMLCFFCERLRVAENRSCQFQEPVRERIVSVLTALSKKFGNTIPLTCREIAEMAGTTVETTIRMFAEFRKQRLIRTNRSKITLLDVSKLQQLPCA